MVEIAAMIPAPKPFPFSGVGVVVTTGPSVEGAPVLVCVVLVVVGGVTLLDSVVLSVVDSLPVEPLVVVVITVVLATSSVVGL